MYPVVTLAGLLLHMRATVIITATNAAIGIWRTQAAPYTTIRRTTPATRHDKRPRPPERTLITDCPIVAQPAMPPKQMEQLASMFASPWPAHSPTHEHSQRAGRW